MGRVIAYSGITTKVKAMHSQLITPDQYREMAALSSVVEAVEYLKKRKAYDDIFAGMDDSDLHRGNIEQQLNLAQYQDFAKLYRFANLAQRRFLDLYFMHYEIAILKKCLRNVLDHHPIKLDLFIFQEFFDRHSKLDLIKISASENLQDFVTNLEGSVYHSLMDHIQESDSPTLFDFEMNLDMIYFKKIWNVMDKYLSVREERLLADCFGSKLDMLNIQWIYRSKKYYHLSSADIYALLIPVSHRLKKEQITRMVEAGTLDEFFQAFSSTRYGGLNVAGNPDSRNLEDLYEQIINHIYEVTGRRNPYSIAILNSYLYFKELEIQKIITTIESIRYGIDPSEIVSYVVKNSKGGLYL